MSENSGGFPVYTQSATHTSTVVTMSFNTSIMSTLIEPNNDQIPTLMDQEDVQTTDDSIPHCSWQVVTSNKRANKRKNENKSSDIAKKINPSTSVCFLEQNSNRFSLLHEENITDEPEETNRNVAPKPPPIFVENVVNYKEMLTTILNDLTKEDFFCKTQVNNTVKINTASIDAYRKLVRLLDNNNISYHTYQIKQERAFRAVIRNLHSSTPEAEIKEALEKEGFVIRNVTNIRSRLTKEPLPLFFIDQEPGQNNKKIYELKYLLNSVIKVEPPNKKIEIPQCMRCQQYGHTKKYCKKPYKCVKCGDDHETKNCIKPRDVPATCVLCNGSHTANYKGCPKYQQLQKKNPNNQTRFLPSNQIQKGVSYAQATNSNQLHEARQMENNIQEIEDPEIITLSQFLGKFESMFNQLINQNSMILNLLTTMLNKLTS